MPRCLVLAGALVLTAPVAWAEPQSPVHRLMLSGTLTHALTRDEQAAPHTLQGAGLSGLAAYVGDGPLGRQQALGWLAMTPVAAAPPAGVSTTNLLLNLHYGWQWALPWPEQATGGTFRLFAGGLLDQTLAVRAYSLGDSFSWEGYTTLNPTVTGEWHLDDRQVLSWQLATPLAGYELRPPRLANYDQFYRGIWNLPAMLAGGQWFGPFSGWHLQSTVSYRCRFPSGLLANAAWRLAHHTSERPYPAVLTLHGLDAGVGWAF